MKSARLGEICLLRYGKGLSGYAENRDETRPVRVFGTNGPIGWTSSPLYDEPTIVIGRKGAYRGVHFAPRPSWTIDTAYFLTLKSEGIDLKWLYYRLLRVDINRMDTGAAIPSTKREDFYSVRIQLPDHSQQLKIASILSAYDDLIENNRRRIQLLEQAARLLYKEWFVHLRFPGHEHVTITDGVPEGWLRADLKSSCLPKIGIQTGPFGSQLHQRDYVPEGHPVEMPKDIVGSRVNTITIARVPDDIRERLSRHVLESGDIVLGRRGDIGRKALITERESGWMCGTGCMRLRPNLAVVFPRFLFHTLGRNDVMGIIAARAQGAIMPNLNLSILADVSLTLPPITLQRMFDELVSTTERLAQLLDEQNERLCRARDLLLPRLMNGEIPI